MFVSLGIQRLCENVRSLIFSRDIDYINETFLNVVTHCILPKIEVLRSVIERHFLGCDNFDSHHIIAINGDWIIINAKHIISKTLKPNGFFSSVC